MHRLLGFAPILRSGPSRKEALQAGEAMLSKTLSFFRLSAKSGPVTYLSLLHSTDHRHSRFAPNSASSESHRIYFRPTQIGPQASQGLKTVTPIPAKSSTFRVTT